MAMLMIERASIEEALERWRAHRQAEETLRIAVEALTELHSDLATEATRRLAERGASEAQVARMEEATATRLRELKAAMRELGTRGEQLERALTRLRDG